MTQSVTHATFVVERTYDSSPAEVFAAWSDPEAKQAWFAGPDDWASGPHQLDFRVGGRERSSGGPAEGPVHTYEAVYADIVPDQRIVSTYAMYQDDVRTSVSLATVELIPADDGVSTRLTYTEQGAWFDDLDNPKDREHGTRELLEALAAHLGGGTR